MKPIELDYKKSGRMIRKCRRELLDCSQEELGEMIGTSTNSIGRWERGIVMPSLEASLALSKVFGVTINTFAVEKKEG